MINAPSTFKSIVTIIRILQLPLLSRRNLWWRIQKQFCRTLTKKNVIFSNCFGSRTVYVKKRTVRRSTGDVCGEHYFCLDVLELEFVSKLFLFFHFDWSRLVSSNFTWMLRCGFQDFSLLRKQIANWLLSIQQCQQLANKSAVYSKPNFINFCIFFSFRLCADTSYEKACRRGSAPSTPVLGQKHPPEQQTTSRLANFFSKR